MDLLNRDLQCLIVLHRERSITRAARKLGLQQPGLSKILSSLEEKLGQNLFLRTREGLQPTSFTSELVRNAVELTAAWDARVQDLRAQDQEIRGEYSIGCHPILARTYLAESFAKLHQNHPKLALLLHLASSRVVTDQVVHGQLHFGLVANPVRHHSLTARVLNRESVYLYSHGELSGESVVYYNPEMLEIQRILRRFRTQKLVPVADYNLIAAFFMARSGQGALLPETMIDVSQEIRIASKPFYSTQISLIYRTDLPKVPSVKLIVESLRYAKQAT